jgi:hypothetical protein
VPPPERERAKYSKRRDSASNSEGAVGASTIFASGNEVDGEKSSNERPRGDRWPGKLSPHQSKRSRQAKDDCDGHAPLVRELKACGLVAGQRQISHPRRGPAGSMVRWTTQSPGGVPRAVAAREALRVAALEHRLAASVVALLAQKGTETGPTVMPNERRWVIPEHAARLDNAPLEGQVVRCSYEDRIKAIELLEHLPPECHVAARQVLSAIRTE